MSKTMYLMDMPKNCSDCQFAELKNRIGESQMQNCGQVATITEYISYKNITVCFEDGTIVTGRTYLCFKKGTIRNPNAAGSKIYTKAQRIGESQLQNCGQIATITEYINSQNITVCFEDGTIVTGRQYDSFKKGTIRNPNASGSKVYTKAQRIGEIQMQRCGQVATITDYKNYSNISVRFEDGTIVTGKRYGNFLKGDIGNPNAVGSKAYAVSNIIKRIGESQLQRCGQIAIITEYVNSQNITVRFEDGTIVTKRYYSSFKNGDIGNPNAVGSAAYTLANIAQRIGESRMQNCGQVATIMEYINSQNITVRFEDGTIIARRAYDSFKKGGIGNPNANGSAAYAKANIAQRIGESQMQNCGQVAIITEYKNYNNITVRFEDGTIVTGKTYYWFKKGHIGNPNANGSATYVKAKQDDS